jgi:class 3 adenylate cyclase
LKSSIRVAWWYLILAYHQHNVYKMYTIGDCYVVIGVNNAHERDPVTEAQMVLELGFEMIEIIQDVRDRIGFSGLDMRIGIHTVSDACTTLGIRHRRCHWNRSHSLRHLRHRRHDRQ